MEEVHLMMERDPAAKAIVFSQVVSSSHSSSLVFGVSTQTNLSWRRLSSVLDTALPYTDLRTPHTLRTFERSRITSLYYVALFCLEATTPIKPLACCLHPCTAFFGVVR